MAALVAAFFMGGSAHSHDWFTKYRDPVHGWGCCGGHDCKPFKVTRDNITAEPDGYRVRMSLEETRLINPSSQAPLDGLVRYERVIPSESDEWAICIMPSNRDPWAGGVFCLFEPPNI